MIKRGRLKPTAFTNSKDHKNHSPLLKVVLEIIAQKKESPKTPHFHDTEAKTTRPTIVISFYRPARVLLPGTGIVLGVSGASGAGTSGAAGLGS